MTDVPPFTEVLARLDFTPTCSVVDCLEPAAEYPLCVCGHLQDPMCGCHAYLVRTRYADSPFACPGCSRCPLGKSWQWQPVTEGAGE